MITPLKLTEEYIFARDLRAATAKMYHAATKALLVHFGAAPIEQIDHRAVLAWRRSFLTRGRSKNSWNTYSSHLRTMWGYAIKHGILTHTKINPFSETCVTPPKSANKTIEGSVIQRARNWLIAMEGEERGSNERSHITPAWFWLAVFEVFYYTGIRLNALLHIRVRDIDWDNQMIVIRGETEKTHREFSVPIMPGLAPHIRLILDRAQTEGLLPDDQLFNVNRFSRHYSCREMTLDQVEAMYRKITRKVNARVTPHRFRHTLASDLMKQPDRNIHLTKCLLNHSNIATTMTYIQVDYDHMRSVLHERSVMQGALRRVRREDTSSAPQSTPRTQQLQTEANPKTLPSKLLEQISKAVGVTSDPALEKLLKFVATCTDKTKDPKGRTAHTPSDRSAINLLVTSSFRKPATNTSFGLADAIGSTGRVP